jgi:glycine betaine transporter
VSKGNQNPKTPMIILWAIAIGLVGLVLMLTGGLAALQSAAVASGFIFSIIMVSMIISMLKELKKEKI